jgi:hypothetical protein
LGLGADCRDHFSTQLSAAAAAAAVAAGVSRASSIAHIPMCIRQLPAGWCKLLQRHRCWAPRLCVYSFSCMRQAFVTRAMLHNKTAALTEVECRRQQCFLSVTEFRQRHDCSVMASPKLCH